MQRCGEKDGTEARVAASPSSPPRRRLPKEKSLQTGSTSHRLEPALPLFYVKAKQGELLPEKTRVVKRMKEINLCLEYYLTRSEINMGPQCFPSFPPPHNSLSWPKEAPSSPTPPAPPPHHRLPAPATCPAWPTDLDTSSFSSPVILSSCERTQINL